MLSKSINIANNQISNPTKPSKSSTKKRHAKLESKNPIPPLTTDQNQHLENSDQEEESKIENESLQIKLKSTLKLGKRTHHWQKRFVLIPNVFDFSCGKMGGEIWV